MLIPRDTKFSHRRAVALIVIYGAFVGLAFVG